MTSVLFVTANNVIKASSLDSGIDTAKLNPTITAVQDLFVQDVLGQELYEKIQDEIVAGTLTGAYETLVDDYIAPFLINQTVADFIVIHSFSIKNGGLYKHTSENADSMDTDDISMLQDEYQKRANHYKQRLMNFLQDNESDYVEYRFNSDFDVQPNKSDGTLGGWLI